VGLSAAAEHLDSIFPSGRIDRAPSTTNPHHRFHHCSCSYSIDRFSADNDCLVDRVPFRFNCVGIGQQRRSRTSLEASIMSIHMPEDAASVLEQFMHDGMLASLPAMHLMCTWC
jgi:hypothetical protein